MHRGIRKYKVFWIMLLISIWYSLIWHEIPCLKLIYKLKLLPEQK